MSYKNNNTLVVSNNDFFNELILFIKEGKSVLFSIKGNSMLPFLKNGEKVVVNPIKTNDIICGNIVLAHSEIGIVLHRIVKVKGENIWLAGDGNLVQKEFITKSDLIGVVKNVVRNNEHVYLNSFSKRLLALCWYTLRPIRIVIKKVKKAL